MYWEKGWRRLGTCLAGVLVMRIAIPSWQGRVSPVLDTAGAILLVELARDGRRSRAETSLPVTDVFERAKSLVDLGPDVLICGALSWPLEVALRSAGIRVIPHTCGQVEQVLSAFLDGRLDQGAFLMPGCCGRRRGFGARRRRRRSWRRA